MSITKIEMSTSDIVALVLDYISRECFAFYERPEI